MHRLAKAFPTEARVPEFRCMRLNGLCIDIVSYICYRSTPSSRASALNISNRSDAYD